MLGTYWRRKCKYVKIFLVSFLCMTSCKAAAIGGICRVDGNCDYHNRKCLGGICGCVATYYSNDGVCLDKLGLGTKCTLTGQSTECKDTNAVCKDVGGGKLTCSCNTGFYDSNVVETGGTCMAELELGATCTQTGQSTECKDTNAVCKDVGGGKLTCSCNTGYFDNSFSAAQGTCVAELELGATCTQTGQSTECKNTNAVCKDVGGGKLTCSCNTGYFDNNFSAAQGTCVAELELEATCTQTGQSTECKDTNAVCKDVGGGKLTCSCNTGYFDNNFSAAQGICVAELELGVTCTQTGQATECKDTNAVCKDVGGGKQTCSCNTGYFDNNFSAAQGICVADNEYVDREQSDREERPKD